jgi:hypothetical protein
VPSVKVITVRVEPWHTARPNGPTEHECKVDVEFFGAPPYHVVEIIPDDDFTRRFDWMMDRAKRAVVEQVIGK